MLKYTHFDVKNPNITYAFKAMLVLLTLAGCGISDSEVIDINSMKIERGLIDRITGETGRTYQLFIRYNWLQDPNEATGHKTDTIRNGVVYKELPEEKAVRLYEQYKKQLARDNKYMFLSNPRYTRNGSLAYDLVLLEANNQFQVLKIMNVNGINDGVSHQEIFDFLVSLHQSAEIEIYKLTDHSLTMKIKYPLDQRTLDAIEKLCPRYEYSQKGLTLIWNI